MPVYVVALGTVTPEATVTVRTQIAGQLQAIGFKEGQSVRKGQFLAQIDPRPYQAQLLQAEGALARDEAQLANARLDLQRYQTLLAQDSIARQQVDTQAAAVRQLEGSIKTDQANVQTAKLNLTYARIVSPVNGRVGLRQVDVGNYVTSGDQGGIVVVTQEQPIDVLFTVPEDQLSTIAARLRSGAVLPVAALDRTGRQVLAEGRLASLDNQVDPTTGTVRAKARFDNTGGQLFPNEFVNARVTVDTLAHALVVPASAVLRGQQGLFVYVVKPDRSVTVRPVRTGPTVGEQTAVTSGLSDGETVVTDGTDRLREGACVLLPGDRMPAMGGRGGRGGQGGRPGAAGGNAAAKPGGGGLFGGLFGGGARSGQGGAQGGRGGSSCGWIARLNAGPHGAGPHGAGGGRGRHGGGGHGGGGAPQ